MIISRLELVLSQPELRRIIIKETPTGKPCITADVHGMKCYEAKRFINNIINLVRIAFRLIVIHGYNHGTAIKEMLAQSFNNEHIFALFPDPQNQGVTHMIIAA